MLITRFKYFLEVKFENELPIPLLTGTKPQNYADSAFLHRFVKTSDCETFGVLDVLGLWHPGQGPIAQCHPYLFG